MKNKTVLDVLKEMGKTTARDVATRLKIEPIEALEMLREQEELEAVCFLNGFWSLAHGAPDPKPVEPMKQTDITELLSKNGAMTTAAIASVMGRKAKGVTSSMMAMVRKGIVVKSGKGKRCTWSLPSAEAESEVNHTEIKDPVEVEEMPVTEVAADVTESAPDSVSVNASNEETDVEVGSVNSLSSLREEGPDRFIFGLLTRGNREKRRLREDAAKLDEVCGALRVLHKHQRLVKALSEDASE
ncbi:TPA: DUF1627 domain-containing protein [Salmonella enterica subsp. enterica serovar Muenchen]|nr:DUF1627 domain-containing protein [Salmonella enterica]EGQ5168514.1 DUF1627 domain-containing protein [Salmonella enterica]EHW6438811.1 DUF1627 domain-containing protein [Salmonella enterica]ELH6533624.1 DUF1627 domain-containing protein [Salmonella enterica]ELN6264845.1 DUF1627 domain-containing protein [Salmonella enterica]